MCIRRESIILFSKIFLIFNFKFSIINSVVYILYCFENFWNKYKISNWEGVRLVECFIKLGFYG